MPESLTVLSPDVQRLVDEGHTVAIDGQYLILDKVPYVPVAGEVAYASIISAYYEKDGIAEVKGDHTVWFTGTVPCAADGKSLAHVLVADTNPAVIAGRQATCRLSYKSERTDTLDNFYNKMTHYVRKLQSYANVIDPKTSATGKGSISTRQEPSVFFYPNTAIARAGLDQYENKLKLSNVAIIGLGGTGSYILDALAKTPVAEIHLYDGDIIEPATVYRMPGALTIDEAHAQTHKTDHFSHLYSRMRLGIKSHPVRITSENIQELDDCRFVFIAVDHGPSRGLIASHLAEKGIPFIDVGMGVDRVPEVAKLIARVRISSIDSKNVALVKKLPVAEDQEDIVYNNIQVAELNGLNAMLAMIIYKQKIGFYSEEIAVHTLRYVLSWQKLSHLT